MKRCSRDIFLSLKTLIVVSGLLGAVQAHALEPEVVLIVGEEQFLRYELDEVISSFVPAAAFHGGIGPDVRNKYTRKAVDVLIDRALLYRGAKSAGISVPQQDVDHVIATNIDRFGSEKKFHEEIKARGLTLERFTQRIVQQSAIKQYVQTVLVDKSKYNDKELKSYYKKNKREFQRPESIELWHIILKVAPNEKQEKWEEKRKLANEIVSRVRNGEDFAELAKKHSEDDYRINGGYIGFMHKGRLLPALEDIAFTLKKDELSEPIKSLHGYHIIRAGEKKVAGIVPFSEAKEGLKARLEGERFEKLRSELLENLKQDVDIKILIDLPKTPE
ncbi:MAG: peptidylprolyl isomerase [Gammaproteobacteria bacterium]|nr:peptidylprolyl isomerase [Gammaproteobacteria bacterium]